MKRRLLSVRALKGDALLPLLYQETSLRVSSQATPCCRRIRSLWEPLLSPGAAEAPLQVPGKVCHGNKGNKGSRCSHGALSG